MRRKLPQRIDVEWGGPGLGWLADVPTFVVWGNKVEPAWMIAVDPGNPSGYAAYLRERDEIKLGIADPRELLAMVRGSGADVVVAERPPIAVVRAFEPDPYYVYGALLLDTPEHVFVGQGTHVLNPARTWWHIQGNAPVAIHSRDALSHLAYRLAKTEDRRRLVA